MFGSGTTFTCPWPKFLQLLLSMCFQWLPSPFSAGASAPSLCGSELVIWTHLLRASPIEPHASSHDLNCRISSSPACSPLMALAPRSAPTPLRRCSTMAGVESCMSTGATDLQKPDALPSFDLNMLGSSSRRPRAWARSSLMRFCIAPTSVVALAPACTDMVQTACQATVGLSKACSRCGLRWRPPSLSATARRERLVAGSASQHLASDTTARFRPSHRTIWVVKFLYPIAVSHHAPGRTEGAGGDKDLRRVITPRTGQN
jgi:hypothetical protein